MNALLWSSSVVLPLLVAVVLLATRPPSDRTDDPRPGAGAGPVHRWSVRLAQTSLLPALALTALPAGVTGADEVLEVPWLLLGTSVVLDPLGRSLLLVAVVLYAAALTAVSWRYTARAAQLEAALLVSFVGNLGVYAAADAVTFYLSFAVMSFSAAALVLHERTPAAHRAGRVYLVLTVLSEAAVLGALLLVVGHGGMLLADAPSAVARSPVTGVVTALLLVGFGVKAGLVPLHVWLPLAHPAAPPAASAVLSGAMVKAGVVGWIRFLPLGEAELPGWGLVLTVLALLGAFGAVVLGIGQRDPKVVLAYSTVSQMGYLSAVVGVAMAEADLAPAAVVSAVVYAVHHGLAKGALFLGVPVWKHHGRGGARTLVVGGLVLAGLAVVGAPFTSGALGKYATKSAVEGVTVLEVDLVHLLPLVATGSTVLLVRFGWLLLRTDPEPLPARSDPELPAWLVVVVTSAVLPRIVTGAWLPVASVPGLDAVTLWDASWPILLGLTAGLVVWRRAERSRGGRWRRLAQTVPAGDVLVAEERVAGHVTSGWQDVTEAAGRARGRGLAGGQGLWADLLAGTAGPLGRSVRALESYGGSGVVVLVLLALLVLLQEVAR